MSIRSAIPALCLAILACTDRDVQQSGSPGASVAPMYGTWDSAGVRIIADSAPTWTDATRWTVDKSPSLDIGVIEGDTKYEFAQAHSPVRLSDGRIAVANMKTTEIRFFDRKGKFLMTVGREGHGPGEFEQLYRMRKIVGDSLMALEPVSETTIFTSTGQYVRKFRLDPGPPGFTNIWWLGYVDGGYLVAVSLARFGTRTQAREEVATGEEQGLVIPKKPAGYRDTLTHFLYTMSGRLVDSIASLPGQQVGENKTYAPEGAYAFNQTRFYHSPGERVDIREFTLTADSTTGRSLQRAGESSRPMRLTRIIRLPGIAARPVAETDKEAWRRERRSLIARLGQKVPREQIEIRIRRSERFADTLPSHAREMRVDTDHNIWLRQFASDADAPSHWYVINPEGKWLGIVETPGRFAVNEIGADYVLGIWRDALDVQHVRMYPVRKPSR